PPSWPCCPRRWRSTSPGPAAGPSSTPNSGSSTRTGRSARRGRRGRSSCGARRSWPATGTTPPPPPPPSRTGGSAPVTSGASTTTACSRSSTAGATSSSPAASTSTPPRSSGCWPSSGGWPKRPSSVCPTPGGERCRRPSSGARRALSTKRRWWPTAGGCWPTTRRPATLSWWRNRCPAACPARSSAGSCGPSTRALGGRRPPRTPRRQTNPRSALHDRQVRNRRLLPGHGRPAERRPRLARDREGPVVLDGLRLHRPGRQALLRRFRPGQGHRRPGGHRSRRRRRRLRHHRPARCVEGHLRAEDQPHRRPHHREDEGEGQDDDAAQEHEGLQLRHRGHDQGRLRVSLARDYDHFDPGLLADPYGFWAELRENEPVARSDHHGGFWVVSRYADIMQAACDPATFSSRDGTGTPPIPTKLLPIDTDPPLHQKYRKIISPSFTPQAVRAQEGEWRSLAKELIAALPTEGDIELCSAFAVPFPQQVALRMIGFPDDDRPDLARWIDDITRLRGIDDEKVGEAAMAVMLRIVERLDERRGQPPREDLISVLLEAQIDGRPLDDDEQLFTMTLLLLGGLHTTTSAIALALAHRADHPDDRARLLADPELLETAVEEFVRVATPVQGLGRTVTRDTTLSGCPLQEGDRV